MFIIFLSLLTLLLTFHKCLWICYSSQSPIKRGHLSQGQAIKMCAIPDIQRGLHITKPTKALVSSWKRNPKSSQGQTETTFLKAERIQRALINSASQPSHWMRVCLKLSSPLSFGQILFLTADLKTVEANLVISVESLSIKINNEAIC